MRIVMRKNNVERIADNNSAKANLEKLGYKEVAPVQPVSQEGAEAVGNVNYDHKKVEELRQIAAEMGIEGSETMKKGELIKIITALEE